MDERVYIDFPLLSEQANIIWDGLDIVADVYDPFRLDTNECGAKSAAAA
jgi:hypothetical protein